MAVKGGILLVIVNMNRILDINTVDLLIEVEAGAITEDVDNMARKHSFFTLLTPGA
ncbi:MAG: FAD-binding protein [Actinomycetota bacterium]|nr:FAD-binding protein [Actinomycetota bacterium]